MSSRKLPEIGTRVTVYWPDDDAWYKGTVISKREDDSEYWIEYDDGDFGWLNPEKDRYRASHKPSSTFLPERSNQHLKREQRVAKLTVGTRLAVWWTLEKAYFNGTLERIDESEKNPHHIVYDDQDNEQTNLVFRKWKLIDKKADLLKVGSRVSVWNEKSKKHVPATVLQIQQGEDKPHCVLYDGTRRNQWLNLAVHPFFDIPTHEETGARPTANTLKKRKREFLEPEMPSRKKHVKEEIATNEEDGLPVETNTELQKPVCQEKCGICNAIAIKPRSTSCHHIFCKACIITYGSTYSKPICPVCNSVLDRQLKKMDADNVAFKPVEALEMTTTDVKHQFSSAAAASFHFKVSPSQIIDACQTKQRDGRECSGFYWRFHGCKDRILRLGEAIKDGMSIEQISMETGEVLATFSSIRKACEETGVSRCSVQRVLRRKGGKPDAGGFFWRFSGETHGPWKDPGRTNVYPVEKLDFETGDVLESFNSLADAKRAIGMKSNRGCIRDVCNGVGRSTAKGFFWRWKGSQKLPSHLCGVQKIIEIRKRKNGPVVKEFRTSRDAQAHFGYQYCWSTICRWAREQDFQLGYYWQYHLLKAPIRAEETLINKRIRVFRPDDEHDWLDGQITAFVAPTGKHEITFDSGTVVYHHLTSIKYEWKNDQGQKPVEQLDLKTGKVLGTFESISAAAKHINAPETVTRITAVCQGKYKSSGGFFWRFKGSDAMPTRSKSKRKVQQLCLKTGRVLATFDSIREAGAAVGITTPGISYCCNGRNGSKSAGGFGWQFAQS